jgi:hypothetical protein
MEVVDALSVYLGGNQDTGDLCALAAAHPGEVQDTILRYQTIVSGRREELCDLTIRMGYVQRWCQETQAAGIAARRKAFSCLAAVAHYEPVRRLVGDIAANAVQDPDEQIRLEARRILLASGERGEVARVFETVLSDTPGVRRAIAAELGRYAMELCETAVPQALQSRNKREVLSLLVSWERALPLTDVRPLAEHGDPAVRLEAMRLLPFLPATIENRVAILGGLRDIDDDVKAAAATAACRLKLPNPDSKTSHDPWLGASENTLHETGGY